MARCPASAPLVQAAGFVEEALRRRLDRAGGVPVRTENEAEAPPEHRDAIAEYYRRLSETK